MISTRATCELRGCIVVALCALVAGCYEPAVRDCTVTCHGVHECAAGQVCGADGFCASPAHAGSCASMRATADAPESDAPESDAVTSDAATRDAATSDAASQADAGGVPDAPGQPDAAQMPDASAPDAGSIGALSITITGRGTVTVDPLGKTCDAQGASGATCTYPVSVGATLELTATPHNKNDIFDGWSGACSGAASPCTLTAQPGTTAVGAAFSKS
jgi:hypothetical protein